MRACRPSMFMQINSDTPRKAGTVTITGIDEANSQITVSVSGAHIHKEPPNQDGNQVSIQPVTDEPGPAIYELRFALDESLQDTWRFNPEAAQFSVNQVPAGALFNSSDGISVTVPFYTNLPQGPDSLARYRSASDS
jgi:hypothetical protein